MVEKTSGKGRALIFLLCNTLLQNHHLVRHDTKTFNFFTFQGIYGAGPYCSTTATYNEPKKSVAIFLLGYYPSFPSVEPFRLVEVIVVIDKD